MSKLDSDFVSDELARCNRCGYCLRTCPTYRATGSEAAVARARNELVRSIVRGRDEILEKMHDRFFQCLLCGACTESCLTDVETDELMVRAREAYRQAHGEPWLQRFIFKELLPNPERFARYARLIALGKNTGVSGLARALGLLRIINPKLAKAEGVVERMPGRFFRDRLESLGFEPLPERPKGFCRLKPHGEAAGPSVVFFAGCGGSFQAPDELVAGVRLLAAGGCEVTVAPNCCCGLPPYSYGDREAARALARQNLETLRQVEFDYLVTECGSCSSFLKRYPDLLAGTEQAAEADEVVAKVRDITELLPELTLPDAKPLNRKVTYHDPCHLGRKQSIKSQPRELLQRIPGLEYVELREADWCCGGAGSFNLSNPDLSVQILERKIDNIKRSGADTVVTSCPACVIQLAYGVRRAGLDVEVRHLCDLLAQAHLDAQL